MSPVVSRSLTIIAIAALAFDGAALVALGLMAGRTVLVPVGLVFFFSSGLILLYWRWHQRRLSDIAAERRALSEEARKLRELVSGLEGRER